MLPDEAPPLQCRGREGGRAFYTVLFIYSRFRFFVSTFVSTLIMTRYMDIQF